MNLPVIVNARLRKAVGFSTEESWQQAQLDSGFTPRELALQALARAVDSDDYKTIGKLTKQIVEIDRMEKAHARR